MLLHLATPNIANTNSNHNWAYLLRKLLSEHGFAYIWNAQTLSHCIKFSNDFRCRVEDTFIQKWYSELNNTTENRLYKFIKTSFGRENYLSSGMKSCFIEAMVKIRLSSHRLAVETGRFCIPKKAISDRVCTTCHVTEDEYHCFAICPRYSTLRTNLLPEWVYKKPSMDKLVILLSKNEYSVNICKFSYHMLRKHARYLDQG